MKETDQPRTTSGETRGSFLSSKSGSQPEIKSVVSTVCSGPSTPEMVTDQFFSTRDASTRQYPEIVTDQGVPMGPRRKS